MCGFCIKLSVITASISLYWKNIWNFQKQVKNAKYKFHHKVYFKNVDFSWNSLRVCITVTFKIILNKMKINILWNDPNSKDPALVFNMWGWSGGIFAEFLEDSITSQQIFTKLYKKSGEYQFEFHYKDPEDLLTNFFLSVQLFGKISSRWDRDRN